MLAIGLRSLYGPYNMSHLRLYLPPFLRLLFKTDVRYFRKKFLFQIYHLYWREFRFQKHDLVFASPLRYVKRSVSEAPIFF